MYKIALMKKNFQFSTIIEVKEIFKINKLIILEFFQDLKLKMKYHKNPKNLKKLNKRKIKNKKFQNGTKIILIVVEKYRTLSKSVMIKK